MCKLDAATAPQASDFYSAVDLSARIFRNVMKPRLPRKVTASARINLNRFWNELEEFYDRRTKNNNNSMPAYTTDTHDHAREAAENRANERLEKMEEAKEEEEEKVKKTNEANCSMNSSFTLTKRVNIQRPRLHSYEIFDDGEVSSSSEDEESSSVPSLVMFNSLPSKTNTMPSPPPAKSLVHLVAMMADKL
jgi:hypothetical protein